MLTFLLTGLGASELFWLGRTALLCLNDKRDDLILPKPTTIATQRHQ